MDEIASIADLVKDMRDGAVETLLILGGNPVYDAPADLDFLDALKKVKLRAHLGLYSNETAAWCHWHVPEAHYLESWSDARAYDGTASIVQPLIMPLHGGKTSHEVMNVLAEQGRPTAHETVQGYWQATSPGHRLRRFLADLSARWRHGGKHASAEKTRPQCDDLPRSRRQRRDAPRDLKSCFVRIRPSATERCQTTRGCRRCRSRKAR